jgi:DNA gyrase inhibitor GyrI
METAAKAWDALNKLVLEISKSNTIIGRMSLYKFNPTETYRAGVSLSAKPRNLPPGLLYEKFKGGKYSRFTLIGPYTDLPEASGRVFDIVSEKKIEIREDFCIENYVNDPSYLAHGEVPVTQILVPTA